jgi:Holliday junction resolvase
MKDNFDLTPLKKKKKLNSRAKGNRFENKISKILNERFNTNEFCRTPGSGAFATTHTLPDYLKVYGDLITPELFKYIIECKKGYNEEQVSDLFNSKSNICKMIDQAHRDSKKSSRDFLLIIGQDRREPIAITNDLTLSVKGSYLKGVINEVEVVVYKLADLLQISNTNFFLEKRQR